MKTLKLTLLGVLLSIFSYGQSDTIIIMVNGTNLHTFDDRSTEILTSTDHYNLGEYKDYKIDISNNQVLLIHLYDNCKYCKDNITERTIEYTNILNNKHTETLKSTDNVYYANGNEIKSVVIRKPNNE
tara:strand:- start:226 stop:609 length:384 start_codon:yes stop_codon:yes gene_type:complete